MASNLNNNGSFSVSSSVIQLRANSGGVPLSHNDVDSNFENLRLAHNSVVTALAGKSASSHTHSNATTSAHGFMSSSDKSKLNGVATSANNYSLPTASSSTLGGVKVGSNINISSGTISIPLASTTTAGVVEYDNSTIKKNGSGQLYVNVGSVNTDTNTTYSAGSGLSLSGTTFSHTDTSSQGSSNNSGRTYIQDIILDGYGHVTGINTATETVVNTNTTYSAGGGLSLSGTTFSHSDTSSAGSVNNSGDTVIQDITVDGYGHVTAIGSKTISTGGNTNLTVATGALSSGSTLGVIGQDYGRLTFVPGDGIVMEAEEDNGVAEIEISAPPRLYTRMTYLFGANSFIGEQIHDRNTIQQKSDGDWEARTPSGYLLDTGDYSDANYYRNRFLIGNAYGAGVNRNAAKADRMMGKRIVVYLSTVGGNGTGPIIQVFDMNYVDASGSVYNAGYGDFQGNHTTLYSSNEQNYVMLYADNAGFEITRNSSFYSGNLYLHSVRMFEPAADLS